MFESIMSSVEDNFLWISACVFVVVVTRIAMDIFVKRSTHRILKDAERMEAEKEAELKRRIEQASRRVASTPVEGVAIAPNELRGSVLIHSVPTAPQGRYYFEI